MRRRVTSRKRGTRSQHAVAHALRRTTTLSADPKRGDTVSTVKTLPTEQTRDSADCRDASLSPATCAVRPTSTPRPTSSSTRPGSRSMHGEAKPRQDLQPGQGPADRHRRRGRGAGGPRHLHDRDRLARQRQRRASRFLSVALFSLPAWLLVFTHQRLYNTRFIGRRIDEMRRIVNAAALGVITDRADRLPDRVPDRTQCPGHPVLPGRRPRARRREVARRIFTRIRVPGPDAPARDHRRSQPGGPRARPDAADRARARVPRDRVRRRRPVRRRPGARHPVARPDRNTGRILHDKRAPA